MEPFIDIVRDNETLLHNTMNYGQFMWNKAIAEKFPDHAKSKDIEKIFPDFMQKQKNPDLVMIFLTRKRERFAEHNFFIVKHTASLDNETNISLSVVVEPIGWLDLFKVELWPLLFNKQKLRIRGEPKN